MNRDSFMANVRQAVQSGNRYRVHVEKVDPRAGYVGSSEDLCGHLAGEVQFVGGVSHLADTPKDAIPIIEMLLERYAVRSAVCWKHANLQLLEIEALLRRRKIAAYTRDHLEAVSEPPRREIMIEADVGISGVDFAIAETGTLAVFAGPGQERFMTLLPPVHIAVVQAHQILPDLFDFFQQLEHRPEGLPSGVALISGPSKTGDIELELTTGIHGPGQWHVVIVRNP